MKQFTFYITALLLVALYGCSQDDGIAGNDDDRTAVQFNAGIATTRATGDTWTVGDKVGVYMLTSGGTLPANIFSGADNVLYTVTNAATGALSGSTIYYPASGAVDFIAYHPYGTAGTAAGEVNNYTYKVSLADQSTPEIFDLLYAKNTGVSRSHNPVNLQFDHALSKIVLNIKAGNGVSISDISTMSTKIAGMPTTTDLALVDGQFSNAATIADITPVAIATTNGFYATVEAIVIPQEANAFSDRTFEFKLSSGEVLVHTLSADEDFQSGKSHIYNVTVKKAEVTVSRGDITDWTTGTPINGGTVEVIEMQPPANCYMVNPRGSGIYIPISQANRVTTGESLGGLFMGLGGVTAENYYVELVWGDTPVGPGGVIEEMYPTTLNGEGCIYVRPGITGNAVICAKGINSHAIKWSWHIWVTPTVKYKKDEVTGLTWMDRNLGAAGTTYDVGGRNGLFYQWGRKDAFPGSDGTNNNQKYYTPVHPDGTTADLETDDYTMLYQMVQNPFTFASNRYTYNGSLNVEGNVNMSWGNFMGVTINKTIYDPCPAGWRVPPISVNGENSWGNNNDWGEYINNGRVFNGVNGTSALGHFYPKTLYRTELLGTIVSTSSCSCWSSTPYDNTEYNTNLVYRLIISAIGVSPNTFDRRAFGYSIRCVKE